ncbi:MAG: hypothetical protein ABSF61_12335 [Anaerolineales bacterium]|jgi:hypothetical protein
MPYVFLQHLLIVVALTYFIFSRGWRSHRLLLLLLIVMYSCEFLWSNLMLLNSRTSAVGSILLASIWSCLTLRPM